MTGAAIHTRGDLVRRSGKGKRADHSFFPYTFYTFYTFYTCMLSDMPMIGNNASTVAYLAGRVTAAEQAVAAIDTFT